MGEPLENRRHELIAQQLAAGKTYREIGKVIERDPHAVQVAISDHPSVMRRARELQREAAEQVEVTRSEWVQWVKELCAVDPIDLMHTFEDAKADVAKDGSVKVTIPHRDLNQVPPSVRRCIKSIKPGPYGHGTEIVLHDRLKALDMLGKFLGVYERDNAQRAGINARPYAAMSDAELLAKAEERAQARGTLREVSAEVVDDG